MLRKEYLDKINAYLATLSTKIKQSNSLNLTDESNFSEDFYRDLLNLCLGFDLINLNSIEQNAAAIDLVDNTKKLAIQVTSTNDFKKIRDTVSGFIRHGHHLKYDRLVILLLVEKKKYQIKDLCDDKLFSFDIINDIWDNKTLLREIKDKNTVQLKEILHFLDRELGYFNGEERTVTDFSGATFNNCQLNTGVGTQTNTINNNPSSRFDKAMKLFDCEYYEGAASLFYEDIHESPDSYNSCIYYCISELSRNSNISNINEKIIDRIYLFLKNADFKENKNVANYLWIITFHEYSEPRSKSYHLIEESESRVQYVLEHPLCIEEKKLLSSITLRSDKAKKLVCL